MSNQLNDLEIAKLKRFVNDVKTKPDIAKATNGPWKSRVKWEGGLRAKAYMRTHTVSFDEPEGLGSTDRAASAHEHLLSAVGACMMTGFIFQSTLRGIKVHDCEIALEGTFGDIKNWAGLTDKGTPGYPEIEAKLFVRADADSKTLQELWKDAVRHSVVAQTLERGTKISTSFEAF